MRYTLLLATLAALLACAPTAAQADPEPAAPVQRGMRVRVLGPSTGGERWVGRVAGVTADSVLLNLRSRGFRTITLGAGDTIEVSRGRGNRLGGAWLGLFAGTVAGGAAGALLSVAAPGGGGGLPPAVGGAVVGAVIGAPVGVVYGVSRGFERWTRVWPPREGVPGSSGGVRVGLTLTVKVPR